MLTVGFFVLYVRSLEASKRFYEAIGLTFVLEKHGEGPEHYAVKLENGMVLELYKGKPGQGSLGFQVSSLSTVMLVLFKKGYRMRREPMINARGPAIFRDPDGRRIQINEA